jgi:hypothetical protein
VVEKVIFPTQMAILVHYFWTNLIPSLSIKTTMVTTVDPTIAGYSGGDAGGMKPPNNGGVAIYVELLQGNDPMRTPR